MFRQWKGCAEIFQVGPRVSKNSSLISSLKNSQIFLGELGERAKQFLAEGTVEYPLRPWSWEGRFQAWVGRFQACESLKGKDGQTDKQSDG